MIPKIIHLIWVGGKRPDKFQKLVDKIKLINSGYEVKEWNDSNIDFTLINQELYDRTENFGCKSDILRFELLYKYGGIYMDYDFLQIKNFDDLLEYDFVAGTNKDCITEVWNSIVLAKQGSDICKQFLDGLKSVKPIMKGEIDRVMNETGPYYLTRTVYENQTSDNYKILIGDYFFPFPAVQRNLIQNLSDYDLSYANGFSTNNTYCIHLHTTSWQ
jgi:mannosyltransferase OCH1-like enzyme